MIGITKEMVWVHAKSGHWNESMIVTKARHGQSKNIYTRMQKKYAIDERMPGVLDQSRNNIDDRFETYQMRANSVC
jgi:hypothetical protein